MTEALPDPVDVLSSNHEAFDDTDQVVFDDTATEVDSEYHVATVQEDVLSVNDGPPAPAPGWVTETVRVTCGAPLVVANVTVALRADVAVLA